MTSATTLSVPLLAKQVASFATFEPHVLTVPPLALRQLGPVAPVEKIVARIFTVPPFRMPPPFPLELLLMVLLMKVMVPNLLDAGCALKIPPPSTAELPLMVLCHLKPVR
jgi:hypothetical protein